MVERVFTALFPFGGSGSGARGFLDAQITLPSFGVSSRFECLGGVDFDAGACADFEYLTGTPELCADALSLTVADLHSHFGRRAPDVVFFSPPCKGASGLLSAAKSKTAKYSQMNELALVWTRVMLEAWPDHPPLLLLENVPRLKSRAAKMLGELRRLLKRAGYVLTDGFHDCGELGGLAQRRRRYLLVARHPKKCPPVLYQPPTKRVRGCGEVLSQLPVPGTPEAAEWGRMHELPKISWLNWVRLALIPAGGDWRDLEGVLADGQARREEFKRHAVESWDQPTGTIGGSGSNGVANVADPRIEWFNGALGVQPWTTPSATVTGRGAPTCGRFSVADIRVPRAFDAGYAVLDWKDAARTIAGQTSVGCGAYAVGDPRVSCKPRNGAYGVIAWESPSNTVTASMQIDNGPAAVADPRKPPGIVPVIIAADGTWHRPLTTLELAALQGFPLKVNGKPLKLSGSSHSKHRERIGNAVPAPAARAIAEQMLVALTEAAIGAFSLSSNAVWVEPRDGVQ
jgi:site-specific DNA-cytosine methylase